MKALGKINIGSSPTYPGLRQVFLPAVIYVMIGIVYLLSSGCQSALTGTEIIAEATPTQTTQAVAPNQGDMHMTPTPLTPPNLQNLVETAKADLAERLSLSVEEILVLEARSVTWPDSSLGCPQEGMLYAQVLTPGYLIRLQAGDREFEYHAGRGTPVFYCENPTAPVAGMAGDQ